MDFARDVYQSNPTAVIVIIAVLECMGVVVLRWCWRRRVKDDDLDRYPSEPYDQRRVNRAVLRSEDSWAAVQLLNTLVSNWKIIAAGIVLGAASVKMGWLADLLSVLGVGL